MWKLFKLTLKLFKLMRKPTTKNQHYKALFLWVAKDNLKAIRLYEQLGFCLEGKIKRDIRHTGEPLTEIRYSKKLVDA